MSLQVWLPLNGDLHNQGLTSTIPTGNNIAFNNSGKIGSCFESTSLLHLNVPQSIYDVYSVNGTEISYCLWVKIDKDYLNNLISTTDFSTKTQMYNKIIGIHAGTTSNGLSIHLRTDTGLTQSTTLNTIKLYGFLRNGTGNTGSTVIDINLDQWYHLAITYDKNNIFNFYVNSTLITSKTIERATLNSGVTNKDIVLNSNTCQLNSANANNVHLVNLKEYFNDVRVYDHCLSPKEVEEIAKGLVLHYKLNNNGMGGENLAANTSTPKILAPSGTNTYCSPTNFYRQTTDGLAILHNATTSDIFTVSFDYVVTGADTSFNIAPSLKRTSSAFGQPTWVSRQNTTIPVGDSSGHFIGVMRPTTEQITYGEGWLISVGSNNRDVSIQISNFKFEQGSRATAWSPAPSDTGYPASYKTTVYDSSGYSHNGTIVGSLAAAAGSSRYDAAIQFLTSEDYIQAWPPNTSFDFLSTEMTLACWCYLDKFTAGVKSTIYSGELSIGYVQQQNTEVGKFYSFIVHYPSTSVTSNMTMNNMSIQTKTWFHFVLTFNRGIISGYINGEKKDENDYSADFTQTILRNGTIGNPWEGKLSDFRIYATCLTDDQIQELYNTSMSIDSNGNIHARELVEL